MAANVESEVNATIAEDAFVRHFHVMVGHKLANIRRVVSERINGFTIIVKEENGKFSYQVATCSKKDLFCRRSGRYYAYLRALQEGFVDVPEEAFKYCQDNLESKEREVINYYIKTVVNKKAPKTIQLPGIPTPVDPKIVTQGFLATFEELLKSILPAGATVAYSHYTKTDTTEVRVVVDKELVKTLSQDEEEELKLFLENKPSATVKRYVKDQSNKWIARYYAIYKLFTQLTD